MYPSSASVRLRADLSVTSATGEQRLVVDIQKWQVLSATPSQAEWVATHIQAMGLVNCYVLGVTPQLMWLWLPPASDSAGKPPLGGTYPTTDVLADFLETDTFPFFLLNESEFSTLVASWLGSIMFRPAERLLANPTQAWLVTSGLHEAIYRGFIRHEVALSAD